MTLPSLLFGFLISTAFGAAFHLWRGGGAGRLLFYLILAWAGFGVGQYAGNLLGLTIGRLGPLQLGSAAISSLAFLLVGHFLSLPPEQSR